MTIKKKDLINSLNWRYATKAFDPDKRVAKEDWDTLEKALVLTPSSFGLQPWKFLVVRDFALREKLKPVSWNQSQVTDCSHYVIFLIRNNLTENDVDRHMKRIAEVRRVSLDSLEAYKSLILQTVLEGGNGDSVNSWSARQLYIALGNFLTSAAMMRIDTCPIEGLEADKYDEILELKGSGYKTIVACAVGYRSETDKYSEVPKVRFESAEVIEHR